MRKIFVSFLSVSAVSCFLFCQKSPTSTGEAPSATVITSLPVVNGEIPGWIVDTTGMSDPSDTTGSGNYLIFQMKDSMNLFIKIDGGATEYEHEVSGYSRFLVQNMVNASQTLGIYIIDYSNPSNATAMYNFEKSRLTAMFSIGTYPQTVVTADTSHGADVYAYAHFKQYYIELRSYGAPDQSSSKQTEISCLSDIQAKIK